MRFTALIPVLLGLIALVLSFLALFAGSSKGFMEDYAIVTVSSRVASIHSLKILTITAQHISHRRKHTQLFHFEHEQQSDHQLYS